MPLIDLSLTLFDFNSVLYAVAYTLKMSYTGGISMEDDQIVDLYGQGRNGQLRKTLINTEDTVIPLPIIFC